MTDTYRNWTDSDLEEAENALVYIHKQVGDLTAEEWARADAIGAEIRRREKGRYGPCLENCQRREVAR